MNFPEIAMTETLFGGIVLIAFIFFGVRKLGLSHFWAGILSGALPFILYLFYSKQHWPGGDVLAIHFAVFLAAAGLMMVFGGMQQKNKTMHWAPRLIIGFFIGLVIVNAVLLSISMRGLPDAIANLFLPNPNHETVHTAFPGLIPHDLNKLYEPHLKQVEQQKQLGWQVQLSDLAAIKPHTHQTITIQLADKQNQPLTGAVVHLSMWRMANSRDDAQFTFKEVSSGIYQTEMNLPDAGRWISELHIQHGNDSYIQQQPIDIPSD